MKLKRRRSSEVPPKIRFFISSVTDTPLENIESPLKCFTWEYDKGDFHHWVDLFNHFDAFFETCIKPRKDLQLEDNFLSADPPFPRNAILQILRVTRTILENCTNKHFCSSFENHLSSLLASIDADVVEACLQTLAAFVKKTMGKYIIRDSSLNSKLFAFAQGWGGKEEGLGLIACAVEDITNQNANELGSTLHFEFYASNEFSNETISLDSQGLQIIHLPYSNSFKESDLELLSKLVIEHKVPANLRFSLLTRLRFARAFSSLSARRQYTCIRLYAFMVLVQAGSDTDDLVSFFNTEPEFIDELVSLLSYEDAAPEKIRILCLHSLVALCHDRSRQPGVLMAVTSGGHRGILSSLMQKAIDSVVSSSAKWPVVFAEALLSLVSALVSSSSGCSAMREAGFIPTLLPLLKDSEPQHLHLVSMAVHVLEAFMDYSNPAAALFRDLGGLDDTIYRLNVEVSCIGNGLNLHNNSNELDTAECSRTQLIEFIPADLDDDMHHPLYSEALVPYNRRLLMKALLRAISLGTYAPGSTDRIYGSEESLLPSALCCIFKRAKDFGGGVFSLAATVMSDLIHKDPTCFSVLEAAGVPSAFMDSILDGVLCSAEAIICIPQCLDALCLNNNGLQTVKDRNALKCFVKIFTSQNYLRALTGDTPGSLSSGLDELMRHASSLRGPGVDMLLEILSTIVKIGAEVQTASSPSYVQAYSSPVPMETDAEDRSPVSTDHKELYKAEKSEQNAASSSDTPLASVEAYITDYLTNAARLLETLLQNADTCRIFVEKKGIEAVLQLFVLPLISLPISVGQIVSVAFKNFSGQHSASLARAVCSFLREHLKSTNELLDSVEGTQFSQLEASRQSKVLRCLCSLESVLSLSNCLLKGGGTVVSELGTADADVLKDMGRVYREILWQVSLISDSKVDGKQTVEVDAENADGSGTNASGRESDDDTNIPMVRYTHPVSVRSSSQPNWGTQREFLSVIRSSDGFSRRGRHGLRIRGGRTGRHLENMSIDPDISAGSLDNSSHDIKKKSPDVLVSESLKKLASTLRSFFAALVKGFTSPNRRRTESGSLSIASKSIGSALAKIFLEAFSFSGYSRSSGPEMSLSVKCRYLGKVVDDMAAVTFDHRRRTCYTGMVNNFYVHGTFKELLTTFEATSQLLWTLPYSIPTAGVVETEKSGEGSTLSHNSWLFDTLQSYCCLLDYFVNSTLLLSPSQAQLLVQPIAVGLSIGLFPVPRDPEVFVRMLQSQVLDVILPVWNHPMFPSCHTKFITLIVSLVTHIYSGVGDVKRNRSSSTGTNQRYVPPPLDEATIVTIVEMGFTRARAEEALRRVETNSVEMAMEWLFSHAEDPLQEDDELARALALSLGSSSETSKVESIDKPADVLSEECQIKLPPVDDVLAATVKLFSSGDCLAFPLTDLLVTLCNWNKGEERPKVTSYLIQQLKLCHIDFTNDASVLSMVTHVLALLLSEDGCTRGLAANSGIVCTSIDILVHYKAKADLVNEGLAPKCISTILLILDNLLQIRPGVSIDSGEGGIFPYSSGEKATRLVPEGIKELKPTSEAHQKDSESAFEKVFGKSTGYLTTEESYKVLDIVCDLIKQKVPAITMQAVLQLCARLTKVHSLALQFLECGGMIALLNLPRTCFFPGYDMLASSIIRHLLEDPQTLQTAMEMEIRQTLGGNRQGSRVTPRTFLTSMAPVISRDPDTFLKAAAAVCHLESSGGRTIVVLSKEREKERDKPKGPGVEIGSCLNESGKTLDGKVIDTPNKCSKGHKKIPTNLIQVIDHLLETALRYPSPNCSEDLTSSSVAMEVDEPATKMKGKSKVGDTKNILSDNISEKSAALAKVTFVLKILSDILLMYVHAVGVVLKRDSELCQVRGDNIFESPGHGFLHHVLHHFLPLSTVRIAGTDEWRSKLSEKASWFLVVLCGRSNEGRRRVINELVKALSSFSNTESSSDKSILLPNKKVLSFVDLLYSILSKNSSSSSLPGTGCSPDIARSMIDGGIIHSLTSILKLVDLDHPDAPKLVNLVLKAMENLTRVANATNQESKPDEHDKKKSSVSNGRSDDHVTTEMVTGILEPGSDINQQESIDAVVAQHSQQIISQSQDDHDGTGNMPLEQENGEETMAPNQSMDIGMDFIHDEIEGHMLHNSNQIEMSFRVENRADDEMGDEDDDMGDDGEDDEDDDEGDDDEDIAEDGNALMSLADTDVEDHDDTALGDEYTDDMMDEEDDDFHENRVIEVRWREALDGLDHLHVLGQPGSTSGLIDVAAEPFEGVNMDDLFGLRRPLGFERRRQPSRSSFERSITEGTVLQHPLLSRPPPSHTGDFYSVLSTGGNPSSNVESSAGSFDTHFYMFDAPVLPHDHMPASLFGDRLRTSAPPPLADFSVGLESLRLSSRRGPGDGRWTDDGMPQAGGIAAAIAQAAEEQFISQLRSIAPDYSTRERQSQNSGQLAVQPSDDPVSNDSRMAVAIDNTASEQTDSLQEESGAETTNVGANQIFGSTSEQIRSHTADADTLLVSEPVSSSAVAENSTNDDHASMEIGEGNDLISEQTLDCERPSGAAIISNDQLIVSGVEIPFPVDCQNASAGGSHDVVMNNAAGEGILIEQILSSDVGAEPSPEQNNFATQDGVLIDQAGLNGEIPSANGIDPTFLEALPEDLRAEVLASQQAQSAQAPTYAPPSVDDIDPEFLAALPLDIQAEVLAQQRAQRVAQQAEGQPVDMDNASIIATFPTDLREEVLLTSSDAVLSALPSPLLAEAQILRDRAMSHYQARSLFGSSHRLNARRNGFGFDRQAVIDRGVGVTIGRRASTSFTESLKLKEIEGEPLLDANALKALIRLLRLAQPLGKGLLQRLLLNLCAHSITRSTLVWLLLDIIKPEQGCTVDGLITVNSQRLYGCQSNVVYGLSQLVDGVPPLVMRRILEILTYLATNHSAVANILFHFDCPVIPEYSTSKQSDKGKEKIVETGDVPGFMENLRADSPLALFLKLLNQPLFLHSTAHLEQVMVLVQVVVSTAASKLHSQFQSETDAETSQTRPVKEDSKDIKNDTSVPQNISNQDDKIVGADAATSSGKSVPSIHDIFLQLPSSDLRNLSNLLGYEGLSDKVYSLAGEVLKKLALIASHHRKLFISELSELARSLSTSASNELITLRNTHMLGLSAGSMAGPAILRVLQTLSSLTLPSIVRNESIEIDASLDENTIICNLNISLEPLWNELSDCVSTTEAELAQSSFSSTMSNTNIGEHVQGSSSLSPPLPPGTQRILPFIEAFFVLCEKLQSNNSLVQQDLANVTAREVKEFAKTYVPSPTRSGGESQRRLDGAVTFAKFAEKHRRLLNAFVRQNPSLLEKSLSMMLKAPRLIDFDNKRAYFRSRIRQQHEQHLSAPLRISVRRAYVLEDSYNQLRMRPTQDLRGRLNVHFQGEEGIDAGGLTREWYQLLSRVIFDRGALLFTTVGNNATFQPNPNSVYQTEHLSYFKFVGRVVAKALFDGQLLDVHFTRSFYKHILGVKVTYHDIEAVDPDYYKNLKWMLENDVSEVPDLTFSMDADEEKHILYEKTEVTDYELKPGGRSIRVTEETKHEYVDLVADHILTNAIRPQITSFLNGFNELIPRELISIFNDKELELLISGLPEIDLEDLRENTEYTGYSAASTVVQWFWEVVITFNKEDMARLLQFVTGTSKVPLEGFRALQGISGPQRFQIHKAYGAPERLPSAHTCFNQLDLPEYASKDQLLERLLLAIHEAEGFGFG
ncbi:E3 ubiquitin-protein ligase UPL1-like [Impatiens glandulifera]|uniref:E3 ubiquitin-protein ligase UPL1-like n=1 Tax=Impatiens glandulifera TaxID=253017 RepID=UPI001FB0F3A4|nr:E3 ubiquitin-protein ligase UPL1-like [Impatiens glandulifera]